MGKEIKQLSFQDLSEQKNVFSRISSKIKGTRYGEPSFLNELFILLKLKYSYPLFIELTNEENFWFEYIINIPANKIRENFEHFYKDKTLNRLHGNVVDDFSKEILSKFNTIEAVEYLRKKFIVSERIGNSPSNQGWAFGHKSNVAYRI